MPCATNRSARFRTPRQRHYGGASLALRCRRGDPMGLCCCTAIPPSLFVPADEVIEYDYTCALQCQPLWARYWLPLAFGLRAVAQLRCEYLQAHPGRNSASFRMECLHLLIEDLTCLLENGLLPLCEHLRWPVIGNDRFIWPVLGKHQPQRRINAGFRMNAHHVEGDQRISDKKHLRSWRSVF